MLDFDPAEPFPRIEGDGPVYAEAQVHSAHVDSWLGLDTEKIERELVEKGCRKRAPNSVKEHQVLWIGLALQSLLTPYSEIRSLLARVNPASGSTVVDLGAGYGRMGFVIARHYPQVNFIGYEYVGERIQEGVRCLEKIKNPLIKFVHADLSAPDFSPATAEFYFIYDYGTPKAIEKTLHDLRRIAQAQVITVVGRGRSCRDIIERHHPWLSQVVPAEHGPHSSVYRSGYSK
jgi:precorrin-6B methylase 2